VKALLKMGMNMQAAIVGFQEKRIISI